MKLIILITILRAHNSYLQLPLRQHPFCQYFDDSLNKCYCLTHHSRSMIKTNTILRLKLLEKPPKALPVLYPPGSSLHS